MAWNEWDPLEEVIVGSLDGATIPTHHLTVIFNLPRAAQPFYRLASGWKYPKFMKKLAQAELKPDPFLFPKISCHTPTP